MSGVPDGGAGHHPAPRAARELLVSGRMRRRIALRVLVVEPDLARRLAYAHTLALAGHAVDLAGNAEEAWARLERAPVDVVVTDLALPLRPHRRAGPSRAGHAALARPRRPHRRGAAGGPPAGGRPPRYRGLISTARPSTQVLCSSV